MCGPTLWLLGRLRKCLMYRTCESRDGRVKDQYGVRGQSVSQSGQLFHGPAPRSVLAARYRRFTVPLPACNVFGVSELLRFLESSRSFCAWSSMNDRHRDRSGARAASYPPLPYTAWRKRGHGRTTKDERKLSKTRPRHHSGPAPGTHLEISPSGPSRHESPAIEARPRRRAPGMPDRRNPGRYTISDQHRSSRDKHQDRRFHTVRERVSAERSAVPQRDVIALRSIGTTR